MIHNFNAGPSILPKEVFEEASKSILNFNNTGLSILEIGHRTPLFEPVMQEARALVKELMSLDDEHEVLFLHGGATTQFMQVPMNLLNENEAAAYTDTGAWAGKAIKEAKLFGHVEVIGSSKEDKYTTIPKNINVPPTAAYLHITTNETIAGTQWHNLPYDCGVPLVADMSSDILSRQLDFNKFDLIYAGAQKNMGAAGVNLVVVNKNILGKVNRSIPTILDYRNHIKEGSMLNTPPVFAIYVVMLTLRWLKNKGGVVAIEKENDAKAKLFYETLDALPVFKTPVAVEDRSKMNAVFIIDNPELEKKFLEICKANGMVGIKGHRSVGGFRVSMYNALPIDSVIALTDLMKHFAQQHG
ncbi:MAG: 3-phosphoserine/phosphohydroxythreonine transaminase [Chitinophagaceae bacterium]|nr:3-phosphoserine/phosphohydroxythreonine transaminase [Chitinophagaceae bacterium]MBK7680128.1 3-phosphoserine/phosphohydroxythreonine transaminase [Chitinophagaceae bacterium]MBK8301088.1 3-phosphoserine/phosphohydroxythreonine transaminase [Chitinophagaceae bacterium]MBK9660760.1 3-phosphoserine/phosphohydroxythreonine transaminase [Chitinophagaceae bacterium]MBL0068879.1 3-phosphoserine/phosphohydroxythreonine transaminase [Chitinophagaceae bacterium]